MSTEKPGWMRRWLRRVVRFAALVVLLVLAAVPVLIWSGAADAYLRRATIHRLEAMTGGKVEAREFSMHWWGLRATVKGLVIHGREPAGTEPLLSLDELQLDLKVESMWGRRISVENAVLRAPHVHIRVEKNGLSNVPSPVRPRTAQKSPVQELFALHIGAIQVTDGWILYNDVGLPLAIEGGDLTIGLNASGGPDNTIYSGAVQWQNLNLTAQRYFPVPASVSLRFTLARDRFSVEQVLACFAGSQLDAQAEMSDFADPHWKFRYRGWLRLEDVRHVLRKPMTPEGRVDFRGEGTFAGGQVHVRGDYSAGEIAMRYPLFSASGMSSRGSYILDNRGVEVPDFRAQALQGTVTGRVSLLFKGAAFRAETHTRGASLGEALDALNQPAFPVAALGWDGVVSADTVQTWAADFKQFDIGGEAHWTQPETPAAGRLPTAGDFRFRYLHELRTLQASSGEITTPSSRITFSGRLAANNSALDTHFETGDLHAWNTFYHAIERFASSGKAHAMDIAGSARWDGDITGPLQGPTFAGHARGERVRYGPLDADLVEGDLSYSPARLAFTHGRVRRGATSAEVEASLELSGWSFRPQNEWTADANLTQSSVEDLQILLHSSYPLSGTLTGQFHGRGTRAEPGVTGLFDLADGHAGGLAFNRLRGQLNWGSEEIRVSNAELRVQARGGAAQSAGVITGAAGYRFSDGRVSLDLVGAGFPLERFNEIQSARLPIGGSLSFRVQAQGPLTAPQGEGSFRVVDLRAARQVIGSFEGKLSSDGNEVQLQLGSAMNTGKVTGMFRAGLHGDLPLSGKLTLSGMDLDPFVASALHLPPLAGHGSVDGEFELGGDLRHAQNVFVDGNVSRLVLNDANLRIENSGPVRFHYVRGELRLEKSTFRGPDTNFEIGGRVQFSGERRVNLQVDGSLDLRLVGSYFPDVETRGPAQVHAAMEGTLSRPRVNGRVHIERAAMRVSDFPTGLSGLTGDLVFDATRLFFDNVSAQAGGGTLTLSGSVSFAETPLRYDITARTDSIRIRYPQGMSWLAGGALRLTGNTQAGLLSGRVTVERVLMSEGVQIAGALVAVKQGITAPSTNSSYLRNLQFDIEAVSTPDSSLEWPGAQLSAEADLHIRGTWEHPIILGHIHILAGELVFAGNRYHVSRGDLNFANPFRLDPVLNVEATTTVQQYEIALNFSGPASKLVLSYRSDPPLPANDIITLLALGKTTSEAEARSSGLGQGSTPGASELLSGVISSQLGGRLERLFGITRLRVDPGLGGLGSTSSSQNSAARVSVEQRVGRNVTITYISNVTSTQQQIIQVEYNVNRQLSIIGLRDQNGTFGLDIVLKKRFD